MMTQPSNANGWHLDKRLPIALILTIMIQSSAAIWWAATINAGVSEATKERVLIADRLNKIETERDSLLDRMTRMEVRLENLSASSAEILRILRAGRAGL